MKSRRITSIFLHLGLLGGFLNCSPLRPDEKIETQALTQAEPPSNHTTKIAIISDLNGSYDTSDYRHMKPVITYLNASKPDLIIINGDMVAGQNYVKHASPTTIDAMWSGFDKNVVQPLGQIPLAPTPGNHDAAPGYDSEIIAFKDYWIQASARLNFIDRSHFPMFYSFKMGDQILVISLHASGLTTVDAAQIAWLKGQLEANKNFPLKIVIGHLPIFPVAKTRENELISNGATLQSIFKTYSVTLYSSGHQHAFYPGKKDGVLYAGMPCLHGPRPYTGQSVPTPEGLVEIQIQDGLILSLDALTSKSNFTQKIKRDDLPKVIKYGAYTLPRDDLD